MLGQISTRQLNEWRAYADLEPFDEERADLRAASIVQTLLNINRGKRRPFTLRDCVVSFGEQAPVLPSPEEARRQIRNTLDAMMLIYNKPPKRKRKG